MTDFYVDIAPGNLSWDEWSNQFSYVYDAQNLPLVLENNWQEFADTVANSPTFASFGLADSQGFANWQDWAEQLLQGANGVIRA